MDEKISKFHVQCITTEGAVLQNSDVLYNDAKVENCLIAAAYLAVFERLDYFLFYQAGNTVQQLYKNRHKLPPDVSNTIWGMFGEKESLNKKNILEVMIKLDYITEPEKLEFMKHKEKRDEIGHELMEMLFDDQAESPILLCDLVKLFKNVLISLHNKYYLPIYDELNKNNNNMDEFETPFEIISAELSIVDKVLSSILHKSRYPLLFKIIEED